MKTCRLGRLAVAFVAGAICVSLRAQTPSIDDLLNKLPPPDKIGKTPVRQALEQPDPAVRDRLTEQIVAAESRANFTAALNLSRKLTEKYPRSSAAFSIRGVVAWATRQFGEATGAFNTAANLDAKNAFPHYGLALVEGAQGRFAAAIPHLRRLTELAPQEPLGFYALSDCALRIGHKQEARDYASKAAELAPSNAVLWLQLARAEKELGHSEATLNAMKKAAEVSPDSARLLAVMGYSYINLNRIGEAIPPLARSVQLQPKDYLAHAQLGFCLQATGQFDAAVNHLRKATSLKSDYGPAWEHLGLTYQKQGNHRDAVRAFERATHLMPNAPLPWEHLATEFRALGRNSDAERAASRARSLSGQIAARPQKKS